MKKIALALIAVPALALAACGDTHEANNVADTNTEATANEAVDDLGNAQTESEMTAENALDDAANLAEQTGESIDNAVDAVGDVAENAVD